MSSDDGRHVLVFNGEIYNHRALRRDLSRAGHLFRSDNSDTEVLLALLARDGLKALGRVEGMYAFALYDQRAKSLTLARDPYGIKPLYYAQHAGSLLFASQVKALLAAGIDPTPDPAGLAGFALFGSVPEPFTFHRAIRCLPAGHSLTVTSEGVGEPTTFASIAAILGASSHDRPVDRDVVHAAVRESIERHAQADVDVGLFLSGGVDSGALLGALRDLHGPDRPIRTVTLGFDALAGSPADEMAGAGLIATHFGADHVVHRVTRQDFASALPDILCDMDQPSIDGVNTWFVARAARSLGLKAMMSGIGGDELLGGYHTFHSVPRMVRATALPSAIPGLGALTRWAGTRLPVAVRSNPKALAALELGGSYPGAYLLRRGLFLPHELPALFGPDMAKAGLDRLQPLALLARSMTPVAADPAVRIAALEAGNYLRNQLLRDADWAGMAHGVEIRTPLVDFRLLTALAPHLPAIIRDGGKALLASLPSRPLPAAIVQRPKTGFTVPMAEWLAGRPVPNTRTTSRDWARHVLAAFMPDLKASAA